MSFSNVCGRVDGIMGKDYSGLIESIDGAGSEIASSLMPSWVDIGALLLSALMLIATIIIIAYNAKTVKAALRQVEESQKSRKQEESLNLYPLRRDLLKIVESDDPKSIRDIKVDIELLLPGSFDAYMEYVAIKDSYDEAVLKKTLLEDAITSHEGVNEDSLMLARRVLGDCSDEDVLEGRVEAFSGIGGYVFNPNTEEREYVDWDDCNSKVSSLLAASDDAYDRLRGAMKSEIVSSLKP